MPEGTLKYKWNDQEDVRALIDFGKSVPVNKDELGQLDAVALTGEDEVNNGVAALIDRELGNKLLPPSKTQK